MNNRNNSTWKIFSRLYPIIMPFKLGLSIATIALIINAAGDAFMISLLKPLLDEGFNKVNNHTLKWLSLIILILIFIRGITNFIANYCITWVSGKVVMNIRRRLFSHIIGMPTSFFDQQSTGTLLSHITYDSEQVASSSSSALITIVREGAYVIGLFAIMFYYSWQLSLILILITPIIALSIRYVSNHFRKISKNIQTSMGQVTTSAEQMLKGHKEVLIFNGQKVETEKFEKISNKIRCQTIKMVTISSISDPIIQLIASVALSITLYIASFPEVIKALTAGIIGVVFSAMFALMRPLKLLTNVNTQFQRGMAACQTLFAILDMKQEKDFGKKKLKTITGIIEFKNVTFIYPTKINPVIHNISFTIPTGKSIALIGKSGSGKSTIAHLITRFYELNKGQILLNNDDIRNYTLNSLRNQITLVSQQIYLFNDTIANNIAYANYGRFSRKDIEKAASMAYATNFIKKLHNGLDTIIGENGIMLSNGQRQRIAIARAILHNSSILIFDEATSALDYESELAIQAAINKLKNCTFIVITHRFLTLKNIDYILLIQDGKIIEQGNHKSLIESRGEYYKLYNMQFKQ